ncbi:unnamed protein product, partial [Ectocarpus sp. 8 AP-2014]
FFRKNTAPRFRQELVCSFFGPMTLKKCPNCHLCLFFCQLCSQFGQICSTNAQNFDMLFLCFLTLERNGVRPIELSLLPFTSLVMEFFHVIPRVKTAAGFQTLLASTPCALSVMVFRG